MMNQKSNAAQTLFHYLSAVEVQAGLYHDGMTVFPIFARSSLGQPLDYRTLGEAIAEGWVEVTEQPSATVPELLLRNRGHSMVLLLDGEEIVGGKQNRIVNASILVAAGASLRVPVSCVEHGRWQDIAPRFSAGEAGNLSLRREKSRQVADNLRQAGAPRADQSAIWDSVAAMHAAGGTASPTGAMHDAYVARADHLGSYQQAFPCPKGATGMIVAFGADIAGAEIFDQPRTAAVLWDKLIRSYSLDALNGAAAQHGVQERALAFLTRSLSARTEVFPSVGLGEDVRFEAPGLAGAALVYRDSVVHASIFAFDGGHESGDRGTMILRPSLRRRRYS